MRKNAWLAGIALEIDKTRDDDGKKKDHNHNNDHCSGRTR